MSPELLETCRGFK